MRLKKVASFPHSIYVNSAPHVSGLLFVTEQSGVVRVLRHGKAVRKPFLDLRGRVNYDRSEQGMYSIAFDPNYAKNRRFYVYYVNHQGNIEIDGLHRSAASALRAAARFSPQGDRGSPPRRHLPQRRPASIRAGRLPLHRHRRRRGIARPATGGKLADFQSLLGKILRIDPKPGGGYTTPDSNPFSGAAGKPEIYAVGMRNPYRFSFDRATGDFWAADVGQDRWEEIDHVDGADLRAGNFGWELFEGNHPYNGDGTKPPNYRPPVLEYSSFQNENCAVLGGVVVHDSKLPALDGRYVYSDFCAGALHSFNLNDPQGTDAATGLTVSVPSSFGADSRGRPYVTSLDGPLYRIVRR